MRLIDADYIPYTMLYKENWMKGTGEEAQGAWKRDIDKMPTIDAVPVVRCKDCKHGKGKIADRVRCSIHSWWVPDSWYCSDGERKDDV